MRFGFSYTGTSVRQDLLEDVLTSLCPSKPIATSASVFPSFWREKPWPLGNLTFHHCKK
jgi:hypothetical protein